MLQMPKVRVAASLYISLVELRKPRRLSLVPSPLGTRLQMPFPDASHGALNRLTKYRTGDKSVDPRRHATGRERSLEAGSTRRAVHLVYRVYSPARIGITEGLG